MMPQSTDIAYWQEEFYDDLYNGWNSTVYAGNEKVKYQNNQDKFSHVTLYNKSGILSSLEYPAHIQCNEYGTFCKFYVDGYEVTALAQLAALDVNQYFDIYDITSEHKEEFITNFLIRVNEFMLDKKS